MVMADYLKPAIVALVRRGVQNHAAVHLPDGTAVGYRTSMPDKLSLLITVAQGERGPRVFEVRVREVM